SEARFRSAFDYAPIGMALVGLDGRLLQVNQALCAIIGESPAALLARDLPALTHPADRQDLRAHLARLVAGAIGSFQIEQRYLHAPGPAVPVLVSVSLVRDAAGQALYFIAQILDIAE